MFPTSDFQNMKNSKYDNCQCSWSLSQQSLFSAIKWAVAANRTDLLTKKLNCITKYYLCSEHFSDDSFLDETKTRLKKTLYPVTIPIPTIFKCNFDKYIPNTKRNASGIDGADDTERLKRTPNYGSINDFTSTNRTKEGISMESLSVFHDHYNYLDISSSGLFFNDISDSINELSNENSFDNIDCDPLHHISEEMQPTFFTCRLCAKTFTSSQQLKDLSVEPGIYETLDEILPDQVSKYG